MQDIKINLGTDAVTGKKRKCTLLWINYGSDGTPLNVGWKIELFEVDNTTPAIPTGSNRRQLQLVSSYTDRFDITNQIINTTTKVFDTLDVDGASLKLGTQYLSTYLGSKAINSYPGVANGDSFVNVQQGILKELTDILIANNAI